MRKRIIALFFVLAVLAGAAVSQAYLYVFGRIDTENVITYGSLKMKLHETEPGVGEAEVPVAADAVLRLDAERSPQTVTRKITVENICEENMYLRMRLSIGGTSADGKTFMLSDEEVEYAANTAEGWEAGGDGWYYYNAALAPRGFTASLLKDDQLLFHTDAIALTHPNKPLSLSVEVQAVQSANNGAAARSAKGWPEEVSEP